MKLITKELERKFIIISSQEGKGEDSEVIVKYFNPCGAGTWLITSGEKQEDGDWLLFGMCHISDWEWGYVLLSELQNFRSRIGLGVKRDLYASGTVRELMH